MSSPTVSSASTLSGHLAAVASSRPNQSFLRCGQTSVTFGELEATSARIASRLLAEGFQVGDRIAIAGLNKPEWLAMFFGATRIGLIVVTLNVRYRERELEQMLTHSGARALITHAALDGADRTGLCTTIAGKVPTLQHIIYFETGAPSELTYDVLAGTNPDHTSLRQAEHRVASTSPAAILYTSGSTGAPKGAVLTHASILAAARAEREHLNITAADVLVGNMPFNHVGGLTCTITTALTAGAAVILMPVFNAGDALATIAANSVTVFAGVPTMYALMLRHDDIDRYDLGTIRLTIVGGSNADEDLCAMIDARFHNARLSNLYGLSESSGACIMSSSDDDTKTVATTLGRPLPGVQARVVDPEGVNVPAGHDGELLLHSPALADGYWQAPEASTETFLPGGWLATGDMVTTTSTGHLAMRGRRKDMYIQGGYNVYPADVENVLTTHPAVTMAAGIGEPDPVLGEIGHYYVVATPNSAVDADQLTDHCRQNLADYKTPKKITFVDDLPTTPAGKIAKAELRKL